MECGVDDILKFIPQEKSKNFGKVVYHYKGDFRDIRHSYTEKL